MCGKSEYWKTGFYYIAQGARVPIALGYVDYAIKTGGIGASLQPSGDIQADMLPIAHLRRRHRADPQCRAKFASARI